VAWTFGRKKNRAGSGAVGRRGSVGFSRALRRCRQGPPFGSAPDLQVELCSGKSTCRPGTSPATLGSTDVDSVGKLPAAVAEASSLPAPTTQMRIYVSALKEASSVP